MQRASSEHAIKILNSLIETTRDSADGYRQAAISATDDKYRDLFLQWAADRRRVVTDLQGQVQVLGGVPDDGGSMLAAGHRMFLRLRDSLLRDDAAVIDEVERGEDFIREMYEEALEDEELSSDVRRSLIRAYSSVKAGHDQARILKHRLYRD